MTVDSATVSSKHGGGVSAILRFDFTGPRTRAMTLGAVLACFIAPALPELLTVRTRDTMVVHDSPAGQLVKSIPPSLVSAVSDSVGASERRFWSVRRGAALLTAGGGVRSTFNASGVAMRVGQGTLGLALAGVERGDRFDPVAAVAARGSANRIVYRHEWISEFYRNGPFGLEQGFVVRHGLAHGRSLAILLRVRGSLSPERVGAQVLFRAPGGAVALSYGRLSAVDATGRPLPVSMWVGNGMLQLRVRDRDARYPLLIDPFIQQGAKLTGGGEAGGGEFGSSVAVSADGNTALVGAPGDSGGTGAAWVFTRSGSTWTQQGEKLTGAGESGPGAFGQSVAVSSDGDTALIGGPRDAEGVGAAWVFTRSGSTWTRQGEKLTGAGEWGSGAFGQSVALSSDGSTALIGGPMDHPFAPAGGVGAAWAFTYSGATWTQQGGKLTGAGETGPTRFGSSVAVSADGNTALIGGPGYEFCIGAAWILVRSGGVWDQQALLHGEREGSACNDGPDEGQRDELRFGTAVALSADGSVGLVSRPFIDFLRLGETSSYARVGSSWIEKTALRDRKGAKAGATSVAVSSDHQQVLVGRGEVGSGDSALAFVRVGSEWAQEGSGLLASDRAGVPAFGESVALSSDGSTALIGGRADNGNVGAAWVFSKQMLVPPPTAVTGVASSVTAASATLAGTVDPNGQEVFNCHFEYGTTTSYGSNTPCGALPGAGESPVEASALAQGLTANTTYHFRLVAANGGGVAYGADETLTTQPGPPAVVTGAASSITRTAATLTASVNPLGETVSDCHFEYGVSASYGSSVPCSPLPGSGSGAVEVSAPIGSLSEYHPYHFRIVATNSIGTSYGADRTFNTLSNAPEYGKCLEVTSHAGLYANSGCTKWGSGMRYEWHPGAVGIPITVKLAAGAAAFETVNRSLITCTSETGSGEYTGQKTLGGILLTFGGCEELGEKCASLFAAEGELVTNPLEGVLGVIRLGSTSASSMIGLEIFPAKNTGAFMEFGCGLTTVTLRGAVIVQLVTNKMLAATTLKYSASRGKQHPERFLGEPAAILEASFGNKAYEQTGLTLEATQASGAPVETNAVA